MKRCDLKEDVTILIGRLITLIWDDYRAPGNEDDTEPSMLLTIGASATGWNFQTGDNSFTGGAYSYRNWGTTTLYRDSVPADAAEDIIVDLESCVDWSTDTIHEAFGADWEQTTSTGSNDDGQ